MSDWTVEDSIAAAKGDPERAGRQLYELSNKRIQLSNELRDRRGWLDMKDPRAKSLGDIMLHIQTGHDTKGNMFWMTVIGRWEGKWNGSGLVDMSPSYWSPIPDVPEALRVAK